MAEPFLGEIRTFSFGFAPKGWAMCNGQLLPINQNQALFSLLGTQFGGDGRITFALPNFQGRLALGMGTSSTGTGFTIGEVLGEATHTLLEAEMPAHNHAIAASVNGTSNATNIPSSTVVLGSGSSSGAGTPAVSIYDSTAPGTAMLPLGDTGDGEPHQNLMPFTVLSYCIALQGIFPSRN
jgi:microcystin-dependent protein